MAVESLSEAISRLTNDGYNRSFRASEGCLEDTETKAKFAPQDLQVDSVVRFEGETDIDEESAIFALSHAKSSTKGIYIVAYGPQMDAKDIDVVQKLGGS